MELLQIFNRKTGEWSRRISIDAGYSESFVLDKSTDIADGIRWTEYQLEEPSYSDDDWVLFLHIENKDDPILYDENGITTNATQYIIKSITKDFDAFNEMWGVSVVLEEPIERFNRVLGETLSFTNQTQKQVLGDFVSLTTPVVGMSAANKKVRLTYRGGTYNETIISEQGGITKYVGVYWYATTEYPKYIIQYGDDNDYITGDITGDYIDIDLTPYGFGEITSVDNNKESIQFVSSYSDPTYYKNAYNYYTALRRWLMVTPANCDTYTYFSNTDNYQANNRAANKSWYNRLKIIDEQWLRSIDFADDTWNELDLYRILFDKYDPLGRTPVAYFDLNTETDLPNNMARDEYLLKFERQDGFDKPVIEFNTLANSCTGYTVTKDNSTTITGLICNAENLSARSNSSFPAKNFYAVPEVDIDVRNLNVAPYTQAGTDNWVIRFPSAIKKISRVLKCTIEGNNVESPIRLKRVNADLTNKVLEKQQYLAYGDRAASPTTDATLLWYEEGDNLLHIKEYKAGTASGTGKIYYIEYEPLPSAKIIIGEEEKAQQINQTSSQIDAESFGRFANAYLKGSNKADITIGRFYYNYFDFENLIGSRVNQNSKIYMITQVAYKNIGAAGYNVFLQLNENHMRKNAAYRAPQEIRTNTAIATNNLKNRLTAIKQVVKISFSQAETATNDSFQFLTDKKMLLSALCPNLIDSKYFPQAALFKGKSKLYKNASLTDEVNKEIFRYLPLSKILSYNQIGLSVNFYGNADAGKSKAAGLNLITSETGTFRSVVSQYPTIYTDAFGEVAKASLYFSAFGGGDDFIDVNYNYADGDFVDDNIASPEFDRTLTNYNRVANLPVLENNDINKLVNNASVDVGDMVYFKDMLELFNVTVWLEVFSKDIIILGSLLKLSRLLNADDTHSLKVITYNSKKAEIDSFTDGQKNSATVVSFITTANSIEYTLSKPLSLITTEAFGISTANNEMLLICNNIQPSIISELSQSKLTMYFK